MEIVDAQIHDPRPAQPVDAKYGEDVHLLMSCELAREAMDSVGVDMALVNSRQEVCDYFVARYPDRFASCPYWDNATADVDGVVAGYRQRAGMLAPRVLIMDFPSERPSDDFKAGRLEPLFVAAERHQLPLFAMAMGLADELAQVARAHPELTLIVDHLGITSPPWMTRNPDPWTELPSVLALARFPNVAVKLSGAIALSRTPYPHPDLWPRLHKLIDAFGPQRLMWGSDFTRLRSARGMNQRAPREAWVGLYSDCVSFFRDTTEISQADKEAIFAGTIRRLLRWPKGL
jgi:L-fuconolactonase